MGNCANVEHDTCTSVERGEEPDMSLGDICVLCACRECDRCGTVIDLDCEHQIVEPLGGGFGYVDVCDRCVRDTDRREVGHPDVQVEATTIPSKPSTTGR